MTFHFGPVTTATLCRLILVASLAIPESRGQEIDVWIGTGGRPSRGIYQCQLDLSSGRLSPSRLVAEIGSPGFLAMHPSLPRLYAVGALDGVPVVASYLVAGSGVEASLEQTSYAPIGDGGATHVAVSEDGRLLLTAQYGAGSTAVFPLDEQGNVSERSDLVKHVGGSRVVPGRQDSAHAHWVGFSPDQRFALVPDLGLDQVLIFRVDASRAILQPHGFGATPPGSGPRHMKFHPDGKWIYVLNELDLSVSFFEWDAELGQMSLQQTIPCVDASQLEPLQFKSSSEIRVHPNGRFVYAANRGHDSITVFAVAADGKLTWIQNEPVRGATPRNFNLDPSGRWLLAAGQDSHTLASFRVDPDSGRLAYAASIISTPTPICVLMQHE